MELCDFVFLDGLQEVFVNKIEHDVDWYVELRSLKNSVGLTVGVVKGEEADPAFGGDGVFACALILGVSDVFEQHGLLHVGDEVVMSLTRMSQRHYFPNSAPEQVG